MSKRRARNWPRHLWTILCRVVLWTVYPIRWAIQLVAEAFYGIVVMHVPHDAQCIVVYAEGDDGVKKATKLAQAISDSGVCSASIIVADSKITVCRLRDAPTNLREAIKKELLT